MEYRKQLTQELRSPLYSELVKGAVLCQHCSSRLLIFSSMPLIASFHTVYTLNLLRAAAYILGHLMLLLTIPQLDSPLAMATTPMMTSSLD
jgi:hypothetical protein